MWLYIHGKFQECGDITENSTSMNPEVNLKVQILIRNKCE